MCTNASEQSAASIIRKLKKKGEGSMFHQNFDIDVPKYKTSNFHCVLYVVRFLLGNSPACEFYMPTFWNTLSVPSS